MTVERPPIQVIAAPNGLMRARRGASVVARGALAARGGLRRAAGVEADLRADMVYLQEVKIG